MKKTVALLLALTLVLLAGCSGVAAPTPTPTAVPTPEPTPEDPHNIPMSGLLTDVLDSEQRDFLAGLKKEPPTTAVVKLGDQPAAVVLDLDDVRNICSVLTELELSAKTDLADGDDNSLTLVKSDGKSCTVTFKGENLAVSGAYYVAEGADTLLNLMRGAAAELKLEAEKNKALLGTEEFSNCSYENEEDRMQLRVVSQPATVGSTDGQNSQTVEVQLAVTNTAEHILMSAKLVANFVDAEGRVVASVPVDLDFNSAPVYVYETRDYTLSQTLYNVTGADLGSGAPLAAGVMIKVVSVNAPNEEGH